MPDVKKVIHDLEQCLDDSIAAVVPADTVRDALALLKEQGPVKPVWHECNEYIGYFACGACGANMGTNPKYCWYCGRKVKWND